MTPQDYVERVNRAIDHVMRDLAQPLRLETVSATAGLSAFHFHRVFKAFVGETLGQFVKRQRLERALRLMSHAPRRPLTALALDCGFASSSDFSRSFRQHYGVPPSRFDLRGFRAARRQALADSLPAATWPDRATARSAGQNPDGFSVQMRDLPARTVAYLRVPDPYRPGVVQAASERLLAWAEARGLADGAWLGYMWEEPEITDAAKCRYDVAVVADDVQPGGEIGRLRFPAMRVAEVALRGDLALEARAIDWLYSSWLPTSGYVPDDQPAFEAWVGRPYAHGSGHFEIDLQLPVTRA